MVVSTILTKKGFNKFQIVKLIPKNYEYCRKTYFKELRIINTFIFSSQKGFDSYPARWIIYLNFI